jgi:hypothetical protein
MPSSKAFADPRGGCRAGGSMLLARNEKNHFFLPSADLVNVCFSIQWTAAALGELAV